MRREQRPFVYGSVKRTDISGPPAALVPSAGTIADEIAEHTTVTALRPFIAEFSASARKLEAEARMAAVERFDSERKIATKKQCPRQLVRAQDEHNRGEKLAALTESGAEVQKLIALGSISRGSAADGGSATKLGRRQGVVVISGGGYQVPGSPHP